MNAPTNAGSYYISNTVASDANFNGVTNSLSFTINQATSTATLAVAITPVTYNGSGQSATVSITASNTTGSVMPLAPNTDSITDIAAKINEVIARLQRM